jgi:hypothetical protein
VTEAARLKQVKTNPSFDKKARFRLTASIALGSFAALISTAAHAEWKLIDDWKEVRRLYVELPAKPLDFSKKQILVRLLEADYDQPNVVHRKGDVRSMAVTHLVDCAVGAESSYQFYDYPGKMAQGRGTYNSGKSLIKAKQELSRPWKGSSIDDMIQLGCKSLGFQAPEGKIYPKSVEP